MKRTNVIVDEELLEAARRVTGEKTYSGAIHKALEEYVRRAEVRALLREVQARAGEHFYPADYLQQIRPNAYPPPPPRKGGKAMKTKAKRRAPR